MPILIPNRLDGSGLSRRLHVGDTDTALVLRLFDLSDGVWDPIVDPYPPPLDVSAAVIGVDLVMRFERPGDEIGDAPIVTDEVATFLTMPSGLPGAVGDGTDGYIEFRSPPGFLDRPGRWRREGIVQLSPGTWASEIVEFQVHQTL